MFNEAACAEYFVIIFMFCLKFFGSFYDKLGVPYLPISVQRNIPQLALPTKAVVQICSVNKVFLEFRKIHRKAPVSESLF